MKALNKGNIHGARRYQEGGITPMVQRTASQVTLPQSNQGLMAQSPTISTKPIGSDMNVAELWQHVTGTPWSEAHSRHLTDGYAQSNMELRSVLLGENPLEALKNIEQAAQAEEAQSVQPATALPQKEAAQPATIAQVPDSPRVLANKGNQSFPSRQQQVQPDSTQRVPATDSTQVAPAADSTGMPGPLVPSQVVAPGGQGGNWGSTAINIGLGVGGVGGAAYSIMKRIKKIKAAKLAKAEGKAAPVEEVKPVVDNPEVAPAAEVKPTIEPIAAKEAPSTVKSGTPVEAKSALPTKVTQPSSEPAYRKTMGDGKKSASSVWDKLKANKPQYSGLPEINPQQAGKTPVQWALKPFDQKTGGAVTSFPEIAAESTAPTKTALVTTPKPKIAPRKPAVTKSTVKPTTKELAPNTAEATKGTKKAVSKAGEQTSLLGDLEGVVSKLGKKGGEAISAVGAKGKAILGSSEAKSVEKAIGEAVVGILKKIR